MLNSIAYWLMKKRMHQIELFMKYPFEVQDESLKKLIFSAKDTEWGKKFSYASVQNLDQFKKNVPIQDYESLKPFIDRIRKGEQNILWHSEIKWFAKSSGTTNDKSKFIPVSEESLEECHYKGGKDMVSIHCNNHPETKIFKGKNLALGGSHEADNLTNQDARHGDLSAIIIENLPKWAEYLRAPDISIALMNEWEEKLEKMARATMEENVTSIAGVPSWMLILLKHILAISGKKNISEVWPNLEVFFHGGVNFSPYKEQFKSIFNSSTISYTETYTASEGFFGLQDLDGVDGEMLLMLDYGIFYEFLPMQNFGKENPKTLTLEEVDTHTHYALIISTSAGLWRYMLGDTIQFTSLHPFRFRITGRTKHFINAFGEEVIIDNAESALKVACEKTGAIIKEYTAAPVYISDKSSGAHEWLIEFEKKPESLDYFTEILDNALKSINSDYEAKRYHDMILKKPTVHAATEGAFYKWLKQKNKLGGQYKVPRLSNDRKYLDEVLAGMND